MTLNEQNPSLVIFTTPKNKEVLFPEQALIPLGDLAQVHFVHDPDFSKAEILWQEGIMKVVALDPDLFNWQPDSETLSKVFGLKAVCLQTTAFDWIDSQLLGKKDIAVCNLRGFSTEAVAEWALFMAMALARKVPVTMSKDSEINYEEDQGIELKGRKAAVIGLGSIGKRIAELCLGIRMEVMYWSRQSRDERFILKKLLIFSLKQILFSLL